MNHANTWTELFMEMRRLYHSVSTLLLDVDRSMGLRGFSVAHGKANQIGIDRSGDIHAPDFWAPAWIARFYQLQSKPPPAGPVAYVACVLSDGGGEDFELPSGGEPVLTWGVLRYQGIGGWRYWLAKSWLWFAKGRVPDGQWVEACPAEWQEKYGIEKIETAALALPGIDSRAELEQKVIAPLLARLDPPTEATGQKPEDVFELLMHFPAGARTKSDIDQQLAEERGTWG